MTALRWIARFVFVVSLLTWLGLTLKSAQQPESWPAAKRRTAAFLAMVGAGVAVITLAKKGPEDEEETY